MIRTLIISAAVFTIGLAGCSLLDGPELPDGVGTVSFRFVSDPASGTATINGASSAALAQSMALADSVLVCVYHPGSSGIPEVCAGADMTPPADTVDIELIVTAENNKRVAVQLFQGGTMTYFGVNEDVDVVKDQTATVSITATSFEMSGFWRTALNVSEGTSFAFVWNSVENATSYRFQVSTTPDFSAPLELSVSDTVLPITPGSLTKNDYWFRVAAENVYTTSEFSSTQYIDVYGAPAITNVSPLEGARGEEITIQGDDLDFPGTTVTLYGQDCAVTAITRTEMTVAIPDRSFTDFFTVTNEAGGTDTPSPVSVQTIAYVMGDLVNGDFTTANDYKAMIDAYGDVIKYSTVSIIPYTLIDVLNIDMTIFDLIIVGWDSGNLGDWSAVDQKIVDAMEQSGASAIGIGVGGASYFDRLNLAVGRTETAVFRQDVYVYAPASPIFNAPNKIPVPPNRVVLLYTLANTIQLAVDEDPATPSVAGLSFHGRRDATVSPFPLIDQRVPPSGPGVSNFLWGYHASPQNLTVEGEQVFENAVKHYFDGAGAGDLFP